MSAERRYWAGHPAADLLAQAAPVEAATASGFRLTRTYGSCMWPGIREGDLVFYAPLPAGRLAHLVGQIGIARDERGSVAHRILRVFGAAGDERLVLGGDLAAPDRPRRRTEVLGVARAVYRPGGGFVDLPEQQVVGSLGGAVLGTLARFFSWAERAARL